MIEATCSACGTLNRIAEADVPMGAKFVNCTSCKSRVALPNKAAGVALPKLPPPVPPKGPPGVTLGPAGANEIIDLADLPAPRRASPLGGEPSKPAPKSALSSALDSDLPAPKQRGPGGGAPLDLDDILPAANVSDLPAPRASRPAPRTAAPPEPAPDVSDLPAPRAARGAPSTAPRSVPASNAPVLDLPTPRAPGGRGIVDLPTPRAPGTPARPQGTGNVPADLPQPKGPGGTDLPAPKGFFDDLPQPARGGGRGIEIPEVPAPKGFFDDLPQPARGTKGGPQAPQNDIAPKGFFDDLPQRAQNRAGLPTPVGHEVPAPKGFFDDLPQPARAREQGLQPKGFGSGAIDLGDDPIEPIDLAPEEAGLDLAAPGVPLAAPPIMGGAGSFDELDLSAPSTPQSRVAAEEAEKAGIKFGKPSKAAGTPATEKASLPSFTKPANEGGGLELEEPRDKHSQRLGPKAKEAPVVNEALLKRQRQKKRKIVLGFALGVALLGGGGFYMYRRHAAAQERADTISENLSTARKAMAADDADHWQRAASSAGKVLELDAKHAEAYGIAAEASIAGALADGKNSAARIQRGKKLISDALGAGVTGPALERAQALSTLTATPDKAPARFEALLAKAPKDGTLALYLGWAHAANGHAEDAIKAYDRASEMPSIKVLALQGRASAKLLLNDIEGARKDFTAILDVQKDNIPAQVGLAATLPVGQAQQQESDLLAILARKDIVNGDPRAVVQAWVMAADLARKSGRLDAARERYRKALALDAKSIDGQTGLAEVELREKKIDLAEQLITSVLTQAPNNANAQLVQCEISLRRGDVADAEKRIRILSERQPPLPPLDQARLLLVKGKLHEVLKQDEDAIAAYVAGAKLAGDRDLTATFAAVAKLTAMANDAALVKDIPKEAALRGRAEQLLLALAEMAHGDPQLALTLGNAYLQSGAPQKAEPWLRRVIAARPTDADALYQLGKVLRRLGKGDEAIELLRKAREIEPLRHEIGMELARTFELTRRDAEAAEIYGKLLAAPDPSLELRGHAGKFFVRTGKLAEAGEQGDQILAVDRLNAAGHYLRGEGLLAAGNIDTARKEFQAAIDQERDARYLDGLGRASESLSMQRNRDQGLQDAAIRAYIAAIELDATLFSPFLGLGRLYVTRREMAKAVPHLISANKLKADDADVSYYLGVAYKELGAGGGAAYKKNAIEWLKKSSGLRASAETSYQLGYLYQDTGEVQSAIGSYRTATSMAEADIKKTSVEPSWYAEALYQLGDLANSVNDDATACKAWKKWQGTAKKSKARVDTVSRALATGLQGACQ